MAEMRKPNISMDTGGKKRGAHHLTKFISFASIFSSVIVNMRCIFAWHPSNIVLRLSRRQKIELSTLASLNSSSEGERKGERAKKTQFPKVKQMCHKTKINLNTKQMKVFIWHLLRSI